MLVLTLTEIAHGLDAHLAGLLVPLPIITGVLTGFTHARAGRAAVIQLLNGLTLALPCFLAFFVVLAVLLPHTSAAVAFLVATVSALGGWAVTVVVTAPPRLRGSPAAGPAGPGPPPPAHRHR